MAFLRSATIALVFVCATLFSATSKAAVVISQVYGGGGNTGAPFTHDFIEIFNNGASAVSLNGWSVQFVNATGTGTWSTNALPDVMLQPGRYYLIQEAAGAGGTNALPTPDLIGSPAFAMGATSGKVALTNDSIALSGGCPATPAMQDLVGFGATASCFEGSAAAPAPSNTTAVIRAAAGCTDSNQNASDFAAAAPIPRNTSSPANPCGVPGLAISDVSVLEGNAGTTIAQFTVSLPAPAPAGGVTFNIATQDDSATVANNDYVPRALMSQSIGPGLQSYTFDVTVNGDTVPEANERFFVNVSNVVGSPVSDPQGAGTISNDDIPVRTIAEIQGDAFQSASNGQPTITQGNVVTGVLGNGFFMQMQVPDGLADTSDAIFVFTSTAPTVVVGDVVDVQGTVTEASVVVTSGPNYSNLTKFSNAGLVVSTTATGAPLPAPVTLDATIPSRNPGALYCVVSGGTFTPSDFYSTRNFECLEAMRVATSTGVVSAPNQRFSDDQIAEMNITTAGVRAYREPGVGSEVAGETPPVITPVAPPLAAGGRIWDSNPEVFEIDVDRFGLTNQILVPGTAFSASGILGFEFGGYELLPQTLTVNGTPPTLPQPVPQALPDQITIGSANILHLYNDVNDPDVTVDNCTPGSADECPTTQQFQDKLLKVSAHLRTTMRAPMVIALQEVENTDTLNSLVARLNADLAGTFSYVGLIGSDQDNDFGHINLAFLVRNDATVTGQVTQFRTTDTWVFNNTAPDILFDRPPLLLQASTSIGGSPVSFAVLANHTKSLIGVDVITPNASLVAAHRNRQKRLRQAVLTAEIAQNFQGTNPTVALVLVGDFNAFEFSDGYVDVSGIIRGDADPTENQYDPGFDGTLTGTGANGNITVPVLLEAAYALPPAQRYSYSFRGNAQVLDHAFLSSAAAARFEGFAYARDNTDAALVFETDVGANAVLRSSDHDALVVYLNGGSDPSNNPTLLLFSNGFE